MLQSKHILQAPERVSHFTISVSFCSLDITSQISSIFEKIEFSFMYNVTVLSGAAVAIYPTINPYRFY